MLEVNISTAPANKKQKIALDYKRDLCSYGNDTLYISRQGRYFSNLKQFGCLME